MADQLCSPQVASGPLADLGIVEEVCYGDVPTDAQLTTFRRRSTTLGLTKSTYDSEEVRSDRMVSDSRHGMRASGGDTVTEISPGSHEMAYEALLGGYWAAEADVAITSVTVTAVDFPKVTLGGVGDIAASGYRVGDVVRISGSGDALNEKIFQIVGFPNATDATAVMLDRAFDTTLLPITSTSGQIKMQARVEMGNIYRSFLMERAFTDIGSFIQFTGQRFNSAAIDLPPSGIATCTFSTLGKDALPITSASIDGVNELVLTDTDLTTLTFDGAAGTITAAAGDFVASNIVPGDRVIISGDGITDPQNRNPRTVVAVTSSVLTVAEAIETGGPYSGPFELLRVGLPDYTAAPDGEVLVAVSGVMVYEEQVVGTVTGMSISINNQMAGSEVVGENVMPVNLFGNQSIVGGTMTVLFDRGGVGELAYNAFESEVDKVSLLMTLTSSDGAEAVSFVMPRCKVNTGTLGDAVAEGLPVSCDYRALKPRADTWGINGASQVYIVDTSVSAGVEPA